MSIVKPTYAELWLARKPRKRADKNHPWMYTIRSASWWNLPLEQINYEGKIVKNHNDDF